MARTAAEVAGNINANTTAGPTFLGAADQVPYAHSVNGDLVIEDSIATPGFFVNIFSAATSIFNRVTGATILKTSAGNIAINAEAPTAFADVNPNDIGSTIFNGSNFDDVVNLGGRSEYSDRSHAFAIMKLVGGRELGVTELSNILADNSNGGNTATFIAGGLFADKTNTNFINKIYSSMYDGRNASIRELAHHEAEIRSYMDNGMSIHEARGQIANNFAHLPYVQEKMIAEAMVWGKANGVDMADTNFVYAGAGNDTIHQAAAGDVIDTGAGSDLVTIDLTRAGDLHLAISGNDRILFENPLSNIKTESVEVFLIGAGKSDTVIKFDNGFTLHLNGDEYVGRRIADSLDMDLSKGSSFAKVDIALPALQHQLYFLDDNTIELTQYKTTVEAGTTHYANGVADNLDIAISGDGPVTEVSLDTTGQGTDTIKSLEAYGISPEEKIDFKVFNKGNDTGVVEADINGDGQADFRAFFGEHTGINDVAANALAAGAVLTEDFGIQAKEFTGNIGDLGAAIGAQNVETPDHADNAIDINVLQFQPYAPAELYLKESGYTFVTVTGQTGEQVSLKFDSVAINHDAVTALVEAGQQPGDMPIIRGIPDLGMISNIDDTDATSLMKILELDRNSDMFVFKSSADGSEQLHIDRNGDGITDFFGRVIGGHLDTAGADKVVGTDAGYYYGYTDVSAADVDTLLVGLSANTASGPVYDY